MHSFKKYDILLLDAANTIIHKPGLWLAFSSVLKKHGIEINEIELRKKHKLFSEIIHFPDVTSAGFYKTFNYELLLSMGIIADDELLDELFSNCSYLPWEAFGDAFDLNKLNIRRAVLSNFNSSLKTKLKDIFGGEMFDMIIGSEEEGFSKPDIRFYERALEILNIKPEKVLYIGDSLKLDIIPAQAIGIDAWLIDRDKNFMNYDKRMDSLTDLQALISSI